MIYDDANYFSDGLAYVSQGDENFYIDVFGQVISPKGKTFAPLDPFTTEQTIVTLLRLYNAAVPVED